MSKVSQEPFRRVRVGSIWRFPNPAAGADFDDAWDYDDLQRHNTRYLPTNIYFTLVCDANAANRYVTIQIEDELGRVVYSNAHATAITAGLTAYFNLATNIHYRDFDGVGLAVCLPLSEILIKYNYSLTITVTNIQVGDQISEVVVTYDTYRGVILDE